MDIKEVQVSLLKPYTKNAKKHPNEQIEKIMASIKRFGFRQPLVIDKDNVVVIGHGRLDAAKKLELDTVPCNYADDLTNDEINALRLADNKLNESDWDMELVGEELKSLPVELQPLTGFEPMEFKEIIEDDFDTTPPEEPKTKLGDLYILGDHRLLCGDSTKIEDVERLMDGEKADMVFTDPPYGIGHSGQGIDGNAKAHDFGLILGDENVQVAKDAYAVAKTVAKTLIIWGANYFPSIFEDGFGWIVWDKQKEGDLFSGAELAFVNCGVKVNVFRHKWHGMIKASEQGEERVHPTQKPIALAVWCFEQYGNPKSVLDLFGGSGSTLIACEQTGRKCRMMELDQKYCDVIVARWEKLTGKTAELVQ